MPSYETTTRRVAPEKPGLCAIIQDLLPFYLEGDISPESQVFVDEHLEQCERCASFLAGARSVQDHLRRERAQRTTVVADDGWAQELIARSRRQLAGIALVFTGVLLLIAFGVSNFLVARPVRRAEAPVPAPITAIPMPADQWPHEMMPAVPQSDVTPNQMRPVGQPGDLVPTPQIEPLFQATPTLVPAP